MIVRNPFIYKHYRVCIPMLYFGRDLAYTSAMAHVLLTTKQVAAILKTDERTVRNYVYAGKLPARRLSERALRFNSSAIAKFASMTHTDVLTAIDAVPEPDKLDTMT